jgi:shikimate dehydrogenase
MTHSIPLAGVIGWPIGHSRSPRLHGHWLSRLGISGYYVPISVHPEDLATSLQSLATLGFRGVNVTLPHKEAVLKLADRASEAAHRIGAANTLTFAEDGCVFADNTDAYGFRENIRHAFPDWRASRGPALVLGAGGASRAVIHTLLEEGAPEIRLANRTRARAEALARHFGPEILPIDWDCAGQAAQDCTTVVNTTSLGLAGQPPLTLDLHRAAPDAIVTDIVYDPLETPFLTCAARQGFRTVDGLGMLLHQGIPGFQSWFGGSPTVNDELRADVMR